MEESQSTKKEKLDPFEPLFVTAFVVAIARDLACLFLIGIGVPVVGQVIAMFVFAAVAINELFFVFVIRPKLQHFAPKLILVGLGAIPIPLAGSVGLFLAIVAQNRLIELVLTQVAIQAVALATGGAGEVLEGAAVAGGTAEAGATAAEAGIATAEGAAAEVAEKAGEAGGRMRKLGRAAERRLRAHEKSLEEELGEEEKKGGEEEIPEETFGIKEPTEKIPELFRPEYNPKEKEGVTAEDELAARLRFEERKEKETEERRSAEYLGAVEEREEGKLPIPIPAGRYAGNENEKEVNLEQAA